MAYVSFLSDEHLMFCIEKLYKVYEECNRDMTLTKFYKNRIDPIKFNFDTKFNNIQMEDYLLTEIARQNDKTISNAIGDFHENILDGISGVTSIPVGGGIDITAKNNTIFAEVKNKHNTVKGEDYPGIHKKLANKADQYPKSTCYFVHIIAKDSYDKVWEFTSKGTPYRHSRVRVISGDKFYGLLTGNDNAFKELCDALPQATNDFIKDNEIDLQRGNHDGVYKMISENAEYNNRDIFTQIVYENFSTYNGYRR